MSEYNGIVLGIDGNMWHLSEGQGNLMVGSNFFARTIREVRAELAKYNQVLQKFTHLDDDLTPEEYLKVANSELINKDTKHGN